jgi:flavin-binding protein dodecin
MSVVKVIELIGCSTKSWEEAIKTPLQRHQRR